MVYFAVCIFLSAFLLFQVEPMIAKYILPWFGGTPAVWSTVMMYFQILLTGGYAYAAWLNGRGRRREIWHVILLAGSVVAMLALGIFWKSPITPGAAWKPEGNAFPIWQIFKLLTISVGLPYFLLSANSPLIQAWFHRLFPQRAAYRLYALSNAGSLLALISYPVLVEPRLTLAAQGWVWSAGYALYAVLAGVGAMRVLGTKRKPTQEILSAPEEAPEPLHPGRIIVWVALAGMASVLLLAVTSQLTQEVAVIPFLWVLPLTIYLLSFILAFSSEAWYSRQVYLVLFFLASGLAVWAHGRSAALGIWPQIGIYSLMLFMACMVCHGELYRLRPHPSRLTLFYVMVSVGGALGAIAINFIAPYVFKGYWELPLGLTLSWLLFFVVVLVTPKNRRSNRWIFIANSVLLVSMLVITGLRSYEQIRLDLGTELYIQRNYYGVVRVRETLFTAVIPIPVGSLGVKIDGYDKFSLVHGVTVHGLQFHDAELKDQPTAYYGKTSGVGLAILNHPKYGNGMRVGVLGLGIGTLAEYGRPGDTYRFYEINPLVISLAEGRGGYFSYLSDSQARIEIVQGDARLSLENELADGQAQEYDVLVLDVFSSDSIPVHLLDAESFELYQQQLAPDGILAVHISNNHLDLVPVVWTLANHFGLARAVIDDQGDGILTTQSRWILLARDPALLADPAIASRARLMDGYVSHIRLWTDDYNNLFQILH
jgi:hypothetical protein